MNETLRIEIAIHLPGGAPPVHVVSQHDLDQHAASGLPVSDAVRAATVDVDREQLLAALEAAHARDHELTEKLKQLGDALRMRTVERDHFREDSLLWGLVSAWVVDREGGELTIHTDELNGYLGRMVSGSTDADGFTTLLLGDRPAPSDEGERG